MMPARSMPGAARPGRRTLPDWTGGAGVFVPQGYEPGYAYPLLVWFGESEGFDLGRVMARLSLRNYVAVQPPREGVAAWRAIDRVRDRLSIHPDRIWAVGVGPGGTSALLTACREPNAFAGAVSLGGPFPVGTTALARLTEIRRLRMLLCCRAAAVAADPLPLDRTLRLFHAAGALPGDADLSRQQRPFTGDPRRRQPLAHG